MLILTILLLSIRETFISRVIPNSKFNNNNNNSNNNFLKNNSKNEIGFLENIDIFI